MQASRAQRPGRTSPRAYRTALQYLISRRSRSWGEEPSTLVQPLCRCVDHLIAVMVRSVQDDTTRKKDDRLELTRKEVERWAKNHLDDDEA